MMKKFQSLYNKQKTFLLELKIASEESRITNDAY